MHSEILSDNQKELLPLMAQFRREYYLVGGTAIALYLGHRRSIDFDLFKPSAINHKRNLDKIAASSFTHAVTRRVSEQKNCFRLPPLLQLAAMKAYALGRRSKWKDYVDLYFLLLDHFTIADISAVATQIFGDLYSEKMFRSQLCYFDDVDYTEAVDWLIPNPPTEEQIKQALTEFATEGV